MAYVGDLPEVEEQKLSICYMNNENLKTRGVKIPMSMEQVNELRRIKNDIEYFIETYVKIVTLNEGVQTFKMHDYQKHYIDTCKNNRFVLAKWSRQSGKCVSPDTKIVLRNKNSGDTMTVSMAEFYELAKSQ